MTITFENYGKFYVGLNYVDGTELTYGGTKEPIGLKDAMDLIESKMHEDLTIIDAFLCDAETSEVVATLERENEDFIEDYEEEPYFEHDWRDDEFLEFGYDPYMGCYSDDC